MVWGGKSNIKKDLGRYKNHFHYEKCPDILYLLYLLTTDRYFRQLFYHRIGPVASTLISWYRPGDKYFQIPKGMKMGGGAIFYHPYATVLNAESIGDNFSCIQCTTLGYGKNGLPVIGDNVSLGATVTIIGNVKIGVRYAIVKGQIAGSYYSDSELRQAGDIDYYVEEQDFERAKQLIESIWDVSFEETEGHHHIEFEYKGIPFEQHHTLIKLYDKERNRYWESLMREPYGAMEIEGVPVPVLSPTLHSLYIFLHLYHHLLELGIGLRQFCDWAAILHTCASSG